MTMKKAQLEKLKGKKISGGGYGTNDRFGKGSAAGKPQPGGKKPVPLAVRLVKGLKDT
ncbi:MAG TPA: hypothetical protein VFK48_05540 [Usitatibacter sp.]|nr:hypothetical protein [Usitatibacter sp.]